MKTKEKRLYFEWDGAWTLAKRVSSERALKLFIGVFQYELEYRSAIHRGDKARWRREYKQ
jgi:hypothetical protein